MDWNLTCLQGGNALLVLIHAYDLMPDLREAGCYYQTT
jgi:hypothetical protein